jgi:hypothetical protein
MDGSGNFIPSTDDERPPAPVSVRRLKIKNQKSKFQNPT